MAKVKLTPDQIKYGAMYLAASNLGMDMLGKVKSTNDILGQWNRVQNDLYNATAGDGGEGDDGTAELKDWQKMLKRGDSYAVGAIQKELPFLFAQTEAKKMQKLKEDMKGVLSSGIPAKDPTGQDDGQPRRNYYVPSVMVERDVIENILDKFSKAGVTHSFQGDDLILNAGTYSTGVEKDVMQELQITLAEVVKFLKDEYKGATGKALNIGKVESETYDCVANYTTNMLSLCRLTQVYELPDSKASDDAGSEKAEIRGNIPGPKRAK